MSRNSKFHFSIALEQHTPLLHFQHDQEGAGLRATDVKARLDRFIIEQEGLKQCKELLVGYAGGDGKDLAPALDYKLWVESGPVMERFIFNANLRDGYFNKYNPELGRKERIRDVNKDDLGFIKNAGYIPIRNAPFFASAEYIDGTKSELNKAIKGVTLEHIRLHFFMLNSEIKHLINRHLSGFFLLHNFGSRQTKGFGSFSLARPTKAQIIQTIQRYDKKGFYCSISSKPDELFKFISTTYRGLKIGRDWKSGDIYSKIYDHLESEANNSILWARSAIKKHLLRASLSNQPIMTNDDDLYIRALLGLAEMHQYLHTRPKFNVTIKDAGENKGTVERFPSPLTFKYVNGLLYICLLYTSPSPRDS